jgi:hypothetical protein
MAVLFLVSTPNLNADLIYGFILAIIIAYLAYRAHSLNQSGAFAATIVGTVIFGFGGTAMGDPSDDLFPHIVRLSRAFKKRKQDSTKNFQRDMNVTRGRSSAMAGWQRFRAGPRALSRIEASAGSDSPRRLPRSTRIRGRPSWES